MASIKVKFRPSTKEGKEGRIYYQIIHNRVIRQKRTSYRILASEWDYKSSKIMMSDNCSDERRSYLNKMSESINKDVKRLTAIAYRLQANNCCSVDRLLDEFAKSKSQQSFIRFMNEVI